MEQVSSAKSLRLDEAKNALRELGLSDADMLKCLGRLDSNFDGYQNMLLKKKKERKKKQNYICL